MTDEHDKFTEPPFTGKYWNENKKGLYVCHKCGQELFSSNTKMDSSKGPIGLQGWPAFEEAIPGRVEFKPDDTHGMNRTEVVCSKCGFHLGHIFDDEHASTGKHYCINSCSLSFNDDKS